MPAGIVANTKASRNWKPKCAAGGVFVGLRLMKKRNARYGKRDVANRLLATSALLSSGPATLHALANLVIRSELTPATSKPFAAICRLSLPLNLLVLACLVADVSTGLTNDDKKFFIIQKLGSVFSLLWVTRRGGDGAPCGSGDRLFHRSTLVT